MRPARVLSLAGWQLDELVALAARRGLAIFDQSAGRKTPDIDVIQEFQGMPIDAWTAAWCGRPDVLEGAPGGRHVRSPSELVELQILWLESGSSRQIVDAGSRYTVYTVYGVSTRCSFAYQNVVERAQDPHCTA